MVEPLSADNAGGYWIFLHTSAVYQPDLYVQALAFTRDHFFCENCRVNFVREIASLPVENWTDTNIDGNSKAKHSWYLHNNVNRRIGKRQISWDQFKQLYIKNTPGAPVCEKCKIDGTDDRHLSTGSNLKTGVVTSSPYTTVNYQSNNRRNIIVKSRR